MNTLIFIVYLIAGLIAVILLLALFVKNAYTLEREITINKPKHEVFNFIKHLKNQDYYNKWVMMDPNLKKNFRGTDGTEGFIYAWEGNKKAGKGEQEIRSIRDGERLDLEVRFIKPFEGIAYTPITTEAIHAGQTKVKWGMSSRLKYPMNIMLLVMNFDKILGKDIETSLGNLKNLLEQ